MRGIYWVSLLIKIIIAFLIFAITMYYSMHDIKKLASGTYGVIKAKVIKDFLAKSPSNRFSYDEMNRFIHESGASYRMGEWFSPFDYMVMRFLLAVLTALTGFIVHPMLAIVGALAGYIFLPYYFDHENKYDNAEMLQELAAVYGTISLQTNNGVFLANAVYECYLNTKVKRLKAALLELSLDIKSSSDISQAAENFRGKFKYAYIDTFAKSIEQSLETGNSAQIFQDVSKQMNSINEALALKLEQKVEQRCFLFQTLVFMAAMLVIGFIFLSLYNSSTGGLF